jgi:hypothetical protein
MMPALGKKSYVLKLSCFNKSTFVWVPVLPWPCAVLFIADFRCILSGSFYTNV